MFHFAFTPKLLFSQTTQDIQSLPHGGTKSEHSTTNLVPRDGGANSNHSPEDPSDLWASNVATQPDLDTGSLGPLLPSSTQGDAGEQRKDQRPSGAVPIVRAIATLFIVIAPLFTVFTSFAILLSVGLDPLAFGMLSFYLVMALLGVIMLGAHLQVILARRQRARNGEPEPLWQPPKDWKHLLYMNLSILAVYILFYGVIWMWATISDDGNDNGLPSPWHIWVVSRDLQAKIGGPSSIEALGTCLQEAIPHRNATIADVSRCLRIMGMEPFYER